MVVMGEEKARKKMLDDFSRNPPTLYQIPVQIKEQWSYLGGELGKNVSDCVTLTLNKRIGLVKKSIFEIKRIMEDCCSKVVGGIKSALVL